MNTRDPTKFNFIIAISELAFRIKFEVDISVICFIKFKAVSLAISLSFVALNSTSCGKNGKHLT